MAKGFTVLPSLLARILSVTASAALAQERRPRSWVCSSPLTPRVAIPATEYKTGRRVRATPLIGGPSTDFSPYLNRQVTLYGMVEEDNEFDRVLNASRVEAAEGASMAPEEGALTGAGGLFFPALGLTGAPLS